MMNLQNRQKKFYIASALIIIVLLIRLLFLFLDLDEQSLKKNISTLYYSKEDNLMFHELSANGNLQEWTEIGEFPDFLIKAILISEDSRFYYHLGFDPLSIIRVTYMYLKNHKITGGASTIPQQLARIIHPSWKSDPIILRKVKEFLYGHLLSLRFSKDFILEAYINSVSIRNNSIGFSNASKRYFQKNVKFLSQEESLALVILMRNNYPNSKNFERRILNLAKRLEYKQTVDLDYLKNKLLHPGQYVLRDEDIGMENYHFIEWMKKEFPYKKGNILSTLSSEINRNIYNIVNSELNILERYNATNAAVVVFEIDPKDPTIIHLVSMIGSKNFLQDDEGQVNGAISYRDAGSLIKPILYARAIDRGIYKPNSILDDSEFKIQGNNKSEIFIPKNADLLFWGDLTLAEALANSRNIPAYRTIDKLGIGEFRNFLTELGFNHLTRPSEFYGHGLALGTGGTSLFQITYAYSPFILSGILPKIYLGKSDGKILSVYDSKQAIDARTAEEIKSILADSDLRKKAFADRGFLNFPYSIALKTGTSKDFKNSWTIGFSDRYIVGAWVGNFSGAPMEKVTGNWGAGRIFQSVMRYLVEYGTKPTFNYSFTTKFSICRKSGNLATEYCPTLSIRMRKEFEPKSKCIIHSKDKNHLLESKIPSFNSPLDQQVFYISQILEKKSQKIPIQIINYQPNSDNPIEILLNEKNSIPINVQGKANIYLDKGSHSLLIKDKSHTIQKIQFKVMHKD
jgi:penicillin-binding protein 1C